MNVAEWFVVGIVALWLLVFVGSLLWMMTDPSAWSSWRDTLRRPSPPDPDIRSQPTRRFPEHLRDR